MGQSFKNQISIPLVLTGIFIASSFIPLIQLLILTFSGGLISLVNKVIGLDKSGNILTANLIVNLLPTVLLLFAFYVATKQSTKIITSALAMVFMTAFIFFLTDGIDKDSNPYFLNFLIIALVSGFALTLVSLIKYWQTKHRQD